MVCNTCGKLSILHTSKKGVARCPYCQAFQISKPPSLQFVMLFLVLVQFAILGYIACWSIG